jgi:hypothetical protein
MVVGVVLRFAWCVFVGMRMRMAVLVMVAVVMIMIVLVVMRMPVIVIVVMMVIVGQMNIKFDSGDSGFFLARDVEVIAIDLQFLQLVLELMGVNAQVEQRAQKHVAADAAEDIEVEDFHTFM